MVNGVLREVPRPRPEGPEAPRVMVYRLLQLNPNILVRDVERMSDRLGEWLKSRLSCCENIWSS